MSDPRVKGRESQSNDHDGGGKEQRTVKGGRGLIYSDEKWGLNKQRQTAEWVGCDPESEETRQEDVVCAPSHPSTGSKPCSNHNIRPPIRAGMEGRVGFE